MSEDHENHEHSHEHEHTHSADKVGVTFHYEGEEYTVSVEAAENAGLVGMTDRIQLPSGQLILLHPHAHEDNANSAVAIEDKGGKVWPVE